MSMDKSKLTEKEHSASGEKIYVYNWGEYIDPSLVKIPKGNWY